MVFYYVPNIVLALEEAEQTIDTEEENIEYAEEEISVENTEEVERSSTKVIGEIEEKRGITEKHFLLENGNTVATIYPSNIHYKKDGKFVDIDNTLEEVIDTKESLRVVSAKEDVEELQNRNEENLAEEIAKLGTSEELTSEEKELEIRELAKETKIYENKTNSFKVNFTNKTRGYNLGSMTSKGHTMTWGLRNSKSSEINVINPNKNTDIVNAKSVDEIEINQVASGIEYKNILSNIDLHYTVGAEYVKEDIILNNKEAISNEFVFEYDTKGLKMKVTEEKNIIVYDTEEKNVIYTIESPFMYDSKLEFSSSVEMKLTEENGKYILTLIPSKEWLEDEKRSYPVTIDPRTYTDIYAASIDDTYIYKGDANSSTRGQAHILRVGVGWKNPIRSLVKFTLPPLSSGDQVVGATMKLSNYPDTNEWAPSPHERVIDVHKMTANWAENTANWTNFSTKFDSKVTDYILYKYTSASPRKDNFFNITPIVKDWYTTGNNYGVMLKEHTENTSYNYSDAYFVSADTSSAYLGNRPIVQIEYRNQTGLEDYLSYHTQSVRKSRNSIYK